MNGPTLNRNEDGAVELTNLAPWFVAALMELPELLPDDPPEAVHDRLFPLPSDDPSAQEEWARLVHPELFALLASARDVVRKDLANLAPDEAESVMGLWRISIPSEHVHAWVSALNAGRLALGSLHEITDEDMNLAPSEEEEEAPLSLSDKRIAIEKIHLLGWIQAMLIDDLSPPPEDFQGDEGNPDTGS